MIRPTSAQIVVVFSAGDRIPLGTSWRITAKKTDFYLEPSGAAGALHLSAHGPNERFSGHKFHLKADKVQVANARGSGFFFEHKVPRKGIGFSGREVDEGVFQVARLRWMPSLQRPEYRTAALSTDTVPELGESREGAVLNTRLSPTSAWDLDIFVSYEPYRLVASGPIQGNPMLGPLVNEAGMYLAATSHHRSLKKKPSPETLLVPGLPERSATPNRLLCGGLDDSGEMYWFVETIVDRQILQPIEAEDVPH